LFSATNSMETPRNAANAALLDGQMLIVGGVPEPGANLLSSARLSD
jgi:hypothetical protein